MFVSEGNSNGKFERIRHSGYIAREREVALVRGFISSSHGEGVTGLIQSTSQVANDLTRQLREHGRKILSEPHFVNLMVSLFRVRLNNFSVWLEALEPDDFPFEVVQVFLSPRDFSL